MESNQTDLNYLKQMCRFCARNSDLKPFFGYSENFRNFVKFITTVEINKSDDFSQLICIKCASFATDVYLFQKRSIRTDNFFKIRKEELTNVPVEKSRSDERTVLQLGKKCHGSIENIYKKYPDILLPTNVLELDIDPRVVMTLGEVENYLLFKNNNGEHLEKNCRRIAVKSTSKQNISTNLNIENKYIEPNNIQQIIPIGPNLPKKRSLSPCSKTSSKPKKTRSFSDSEAHTSDQNENIFKVSIKSRQLFECNICNSVFQHLSSLKKHQQKHLYCQFCRRKFSSWKKKKEHIDLDCTLQKAMKGMSNGLRVHIDKMDLNIEFRKKYFKQLEIFPPVPQIKTNETKETEPIKKNISNQDIVEIVKETVAKNPLINIIDGTLKESFNENKNLKYMKLIKGLLNTHYKRKLNHSTQTILPTDKLIEVNAGNETVILKYLRPQLLSYNIPVEFKYKQNLQASYDFQAKPTTSKKMLHWDEIKPKCLKLNIGLLHEEISIIEDIKSEDISFTSFETSNEAEANLSTESANVNDNITTSTNGYCSETDDLLEEIDELIRVCDSNLAKYSLVDKFQITQVKTVTKPNLGDSLKTLANILPSVNHNVNCSVKSSPIEKFSLDSTTNNCNITEKQSVTVDVDVNKEHLTDTDLINIKSIISSIPANKSIDFLEKKPKNSN